MGMVPFPYACSIKFDHKILTRGQVSLLGSKGSRCCTELDRMHTLLHIHDTCIESPPAPQTTRPDKGGFRPCFHGKEGGRNNGLTSSVDSGKGQGPPGECSMAHLEGSPVNHGLRSTCSCPWCWGGSHKLSGAVIHFVVTLQSEPEFQRFPYQWLHLAQLVLKPREVISSFICPPFGSLQTAGQEQIWGTVTHRVWLAELENRGHRPAGDASKLFAGHSWGLGAGRCVGLPHVVCFQLHRLQAAQSCIRLFPSQQFPPPPVCLGATEMPPLQPPPSEWLFYLTRSTHLPRVTSTPTSLLLPSLLTSGSEHVPHTVVISSLTLCIICLYDLRLSGHRVWLYPHLLSPQLRIEGWRV